MPFDSRNRACVFSPPARRSGAARVLLLQVAHANLGHELAARQLAHHHDERALLALLEDLAQGDELGHHIIPLRVERDADDHLE